MMRPSVQVLLGRIIKIMYSIRSAATIAYLRHKMLEHKPDVDIRILNGFVQSPSAALID